MPTCLIWQVERHFIDGLKEITFADGSVKVCAAAPRAPARPDSDPVLYTNTAALILQVILPNGDMQSIDGDEDAGAHGML